MPFVKQVNAKQIDRFHDLPLNMANMNQLDFQECEFMAVKAEAEEYTALTPQEFEFILVKEEIKEEPQLAFQEKEMEANIMDFDRQNIVLEDLQVNSAGLTAEGKGLADVVVGANAAAVEGTSREAAPVVDPLHRRADPQQHQPKRLYHHRSPHTAGSKVDSLLATYETKEMVCPTCHRLFLGVKALQHHIMIAHKGRVGPLPLRKSRISIAASSVSKQGSCTVGFPLKSGTTAADSDSSQLSIAAAALNMSTTNGPPGRVRFPHWRVEFACREASAAHTAVNNTTSMTANDSNTTGATLGSSEDAEGFKTHISAALGGLLDRALNNLLERGPSPGLNPPTLSLLQDFTTQPMQSLSNSSMTPSEPVHNTELAKKVWQQIEAKPRAAAMLTLKTGGVAKSHPYVCFYCESRFENQIARNQHTREVHKYDIISSKPKYNSKPIMSLDTKDDPGDVSGVEDLDQTPELLQCL